MSVHSHRTLYPVYKIYITFSCPESPPLAAAGAIYLINLCTCLIDATERAVATERQLNMKCQIPGNLCSPTLPPPLPPPWLSGHLTAGQASPLTGQIVQARQDAPASPATYCSATETSGFQGLQQAWHSLCDSCTRFIDLLLVFSPVILGLRLLVIG